jgi:hypothetical protein
LLIELKEKLLQWFGHVTRLNGTMILRRALELKFKEKRRGMMTQYETV